MSKRRLKRDDGVHASFNVIDMAIILLIILCGVGIFFRYDMENKISQGEGDEYVVEFVCEKVRYTTADYISVGDTICFTEGGIPMGVVQGDIVSRPSHMEVVNHGKNITVYYPQDTMIDITGSIKVSGNMTENGFLVDGSTYIAPNSVIKVSNKYADFEIRILSVEKNEK